MSLSGIAQPCPRGPICGIDFNLFTRFGVLQRDQPDVGKYFFAFVLHSNGDEIMTPPRHRERLRKIRRLKIGDEKYHSPAGDDLVQVVKSQRRLGPAPLWCKKENFANDAKGVRPSLFRWNKKLHPIGEEE